MRGKGVILQKKAGLKLQKRREEKGGKKKAGRSFSGKKAEEEERRRTALRSSYVSGDYSFIHHYKAIHFQI